LEELNFGTDRLYKNVKGRSALSVDPLLHFN